MEVPTQSVPVSPPPMTTTSLSVGADELAVLVLGVEQALGVGVQELHGEMDALADRGPRPAEVARLGGPAAQDDGVELPPQLLGREVLRRPRSSVTKWMPSAVEQIDAALNDALVELHVGNAVHEQAADAVGPLEDGDPVPGLVELGRGSQPGRPGADHGHLLAGAQGGGSGMIQPSSKPLSTIAHSMLLIVTGGSLMPSTHEPSHGAGQTRPVNSGKLLVLCSRSRASRHRPR